MELTLNDWLQVLSHWNKIVFAAQKNNFKIKLFSKIHYKQNNETKSVSYGISNCRFCRLFHNNDCKNCPVNIGEEWCHKTPYCDFIEACAQDDTHKHAIRERNFLLSLAPKIYIKQLNFISNRNN